MIAIEGILLLLITKEGLAHEMHPAIKDTRIKWREFFMVLKLV